MPVFLHIYNLMYNLKNKIARVILHLDTVIDQAVLKIKPLLLHCKNTDKNVRIKHYC